MITAVAALVLAGSGTAAAAGGLLTGDKLIKKHSLSGNRLRNHTITGTQINLSKLGKVPSAANADHASKADSATTATSAASAPIAKLIYVSTTVSVPAKTTTAAPHTAACPSGTNVTGGGAKVADEANGFVNDSYQHAKSGWIADIGNRSTTTAVSATVYAICAPAAATG